MAVRKPGNDETPPPGGPKELDARSMLNLPRVTRVMFQRNFIKTAVCELRFPALLEYETKAPVELQKKLRKEYPHYELHQTLTPGMQQETRHLFRSKDQHWVISFKSSSIAIETSRYTNYEELEKQLEFLLERSRSLLDSDFFTRVGLRYVDEIPIADGHFEGWIRAELISPLTNVYGHVERFLQEVRGSTEVGGYTFRHGFAGISAERTPYSLDFDFHDENVSDKEVLARVKRFNELSFDFFSWAIGEKARDYLGDSQAKGGTS